MSRQPAGVGEAGEEYLAPKEIPKLVKKLRKEMLAAAKELNFEKAAELRDRVKKLEGYGAGAAVKPLK